MQRSAIFIGQPITGIEGEELDHGSFGQIGRLVNDKPPGLHASLKRHATTVASAPPRHKVLENRKKQGRAPIATRTLPEAQEIAKWLENRDRESRFGTEGSVAGPAVASAKADSNPLAPTKTHRTSRPANAAFLLSARLRSGLPRNSRCCRDGIWKVSRMLRLSVFGGGQGPSIVFNGGHLASYSCRSGRFASARQAEPLRLVNKLRHVNFEILGNDVVIIIEEKDDGWVRRSR